MAKKPPHRPDPSSPWLAGQVKRTETKQQPDKGNESSPPSSGDSSVLNLLSRLQEWSNTISHRTGQMDELFQAFQSLASAVKNKDALKEIIGYLAKLNQTQQSQKQTQQSQNQTQQSQKQTQQSQKQTQQSQKQTPSSAQNKEGSQSSSSAGEPDKKSDFTPSGDFLYDLFNSPGMANIVKEVMKKRQKR
jgi:hypothetical protein